jgi:hypothetical protein
VGLINIKLLLPWLIPAVALVGGGIMLVRRKKKLLGTLLFIPGVLVLIGLAGWLVFTWWFISSLSFHGRADSSTSIEVFERTFGTRPPASISEIRCYGIGWDDFSCWMKFNYEDANDVQRLIQEKTMRLVAKSPVGWAPDRKWWDKGRDSQYKIYFKGDTYYRWECFWIDEANHVAYYQDFTD